MYNVLIIAGPSASGKTTVAKKLLAREGSNFELVRSLTTRAKRGDGFDDEYLYATRDAFEYALKHDGVLENTEYAGEYYGTPKSEIERISGEGKIPLLILDINGVRSLSKRTDILNPCSVYIYCDCPTLEGRLSRRYFGDSPCVEGDDRYKKRMAQNSADMKGIFEHAPLFYAFLENSGCLEISCDEVQSILNRFLSGEARDEDNIKTICEKIKASVLLDKANF